MAQQSSYISILLLFLINRLKAQTGYGCPVTTCTDPNQVRVDAAYDNQGRMVGGCNCACPYTYVCDLPEVVNFNQFTLEGDCSCVLEITGLQNVPGAVTTVSPGAVTTAPVEVTCEGRDCECPPGTRSECIMNCIGAEGCKDGVVACNNDGYDCFVNCEEMACSTATINGPVGAALTVDCGIGDKACEGTTSFNAEAGTDLTVHCNAPGSCKGSAQFNFGSGRGSVNCGDALIAIDACDGAVFNLPPDAETTPGMAFSCRGTSCPISAPAAFSNVEGPHGGSCTAAGDCSCAPGTKSLCTINCAGDIDACKDGLIECNNDGYDCIVNCMSPEACGGSAYIQGPTGGKLTVNCLGDKACEGSTIINGEAGTDLTAVCQGPEACKGGVEFIFGSGRGSVFCDSLTQPPSPDTCLDAVFTLLPDAMTRPGLSFSCNGDSCPSDAPQPFSNGGAIPLPPHPMTTVSTPPNPGNTATGTPPAVTGGGPIVITTATQPVGGGPVYQVTPWCCRTSVVGGEPEWGPWKGRCWRHESSADCTYEPNNRCTWDESKCFQAPPPCQFLGETCIDNGNCCSNACRVDNTLTPPKGTCN